MQDYVDIKSLLNELDDEVFDTTVTVSDMQFWRDKDSTVTVDFWVELATDESAFEKGSSMVRRSYEDFKWLHEAILEEIELETPEPLPDAPPTDDDDDNAIDYLDYLDDLGQYLTALAESGDFQFADCLQQFFFTDGALPAVPRSSTITCAAIEDGSMTRVELAALPVTHHLPAIAAFYGLDTGACETSFDFADKILHHLHPHLSEGGAALDAGAAAEDDDAGEEDFAHLSAEDRRLSAFRVFMRPDADGDIKLPLTVDLLFGLLELEHCTAEFKQSGYDDLRVVATLAPAEVEDLVLDKEDQTVLLTAGFEWNVKASEYNLLDNWALELHRAHGTGVFESKISASFRAEDEANAAAAAKAMATGEAVLSADGTYYIGADGKIDLKHGDEDVKMGYGSTVDWDPTPILKVCARRLRQRGGCPRDCVSCGIWMGDMDE